MFHQVSTSDLGAGISIMSGRKSGPVCSSSERVRRLEDLQFSLGERGNHDAHVTQAAVAEPALPLHVGRGTIGVLTPCQGLPETLTRRLRERFAHEGITWRRSTPA